MSSRNSARVSGSIHIDDVGLGRLEGAVGVEDVEKGEIGNILVLLDPRQETIDEGACRLRRRFVEIFDRGPLVQDFETLV